MTGQSLARLIGGGETQNHYNKANLSEMESELLTMNWDEILSIENIMSNGQYLRILSWQHGINMYLNEQVER